MTIIQSPSRTRRRSVAAQKSDPGNPRSPGPSGLTGPQPGGVGVRLEPLDNALPFVPGPLLRPETIRRCDRDAKSLAALLLPKPVKYFRRNAGRICALRHDRGVPATTAINRRSARLLLDANLGLGRVTTLRDDRRAVVILDDGRVAIPRIAGCSRACSTAHHDGYSRGE
jgi:hypothetical protein